MIIKNIEIKQRIKEAETITDYYAKVKELCEIAGLVAFYGHTPNGTHEELKEAEKMANETINSIIRKYKL